jgi:hypothetical protein
VCKWESQILHPQERCIANEFLEVKEERSLKVSQDKIPFVLAVRPLLFVTYIITEAEEIVRK